MPAFVSFVFRYLAFYSDERSFIRAKSSQSHLQISKEMLQVLFTQYEVAPTFLDFLFTFGEQRFKKTFPFSGFRSHQLWDDIYITSPSIVQAAERFQLCYNLRSVEPTKNPPERPWSIRQNAVFHSFDMGTGDAVWINLKGKTDISPRFKRLLGNFGLANTPLIGDSISAFKATLATHILYCEWSSEHWATYIGFLEDQLQENTRYALLATVSSTDPLDQPGGPPTRVDTEPPPPLQKRLSFAQASLSLVRDVVAPRRTPLKRSSTVQDVELGVRVHTAQDNEEYEDFSYDDLRRIQHIEDEANVALLVLKSNVNIMGELTGYYDVLLTSAEYKTAFGEDCNIPIRRFKARVTGLVNDSRLQQTKIEVFLRLLADRKSFVGFLALRDRLLLIGP